MAVSINSGPIEAEYQLRHVPQGKWRELMLARRRFLEIQLSYDCRCLIQFVNDAQEMFHVLGFQTPEEMIRDGYGLKSDEIAIAVDWLKLNPPKEPIALNAVLELGKRGRPKKGEEKAGNASFSKLGTQRSTTLARLDRDGHAELAAKVRASTLSANAAAIEAGFRKQHTALDRLRKAWAKATPDERSMFLSEVTS